MSKYIVGLTGGIGSGKTTVANLFFEFGITLIDADIIARELVDPSSLALTAIEQRFGKSVLLNDGQLNRQQLRKQVFENNDDRIWLNNLLHPKIRSEMINQAANALSPYVIMVVPLLFENKLETIVNRVLVVDAPVEEQLKRTCIRDNTDGLNVQKIIEQQITREDRLYKADDIIKNQCDITELKAQVLVLHKKYLALASN